MSVGRRNKDRFRRLSLSFANIFDQTSSLLATKKTLGSTGHLPTVSGNVRDRTQHAARHKKLSFVDLGTSTEFSIRLNGEKAGHKQVDRLYT